MPARRRSASVPELPSPPRYVRPCCPAIGPTSHFGLPSEALRFRHEADPRPRAAIGNRLKVRLCAWLLACLLGALVTVALAADKKSQPAALPEVPETLTPAEADAFLAKLTDAQTRALLARELHAKAKARATPPAEAARGFGPWIMDVVETLEATEADAGRRGSALAAGLAQLPGALPVATARVFDTAGGGSAGALALLVVALLAATGASLGVRRALRRYGLEPLPAANARPAQRFATAGRRFGLDLASFAG